MEIRHSTPLDAETAAVGEYLAKTLLDEDQGAYKEDTPLHLAHRIFRDQFSAVNIRQWLGAGRRMDAAQCLHLVR
jgi:hypothetical protein